MSIGGMMAKAVIPIIDTIFTLCQKIKYGNITVAIFLKCRNTSEHMQVILLPTHADFHLLQQPHYIIHRRVGFIVLFPQ